MDLITYTATLLLIFDPFGNAIIILSLIKNYSLRKKIFLLFRESLFALIILAFFLLTGDKLLSYMGLSQEALSIAGSIILFLIALKMTSFDNVKEKENKKQTEEPYIFPIAIPLFVGPTAIAYLTIFSTAYPEQLVSTSLGTFIAWFIAMVSLIGITIFSNKIKKKALLAFEKLMGLILVCISVQLFLDGLQKFFQTTS